MAVGVLARGSQELLRPPAGLYLAHRPFLRTLLNPNDLRHRRRLPSLPRKRWGTLGALWLIPLAAFLLDLGLQEKLTFARGYPHVAFGYARTSAGVTDSSAVFASRMEQFRRLLDGQFTAGFLLGNIAPPFERFSYLFWLLLASSASLLLGHLLRRSPPRAGWFGLIFTIVLFACNLPFPEAGRIHHLLLLYPLLQVGLGATPAWW